MNNNKQKFKQQTFKQHLEEIGINPEHYLKIARKAATDNGYDPSKVNFTDDGVHKLEIEVIGSSKSKKSPKVRFGRNHYGDFILWGILEKEGIVRKGYANMKRNIFNKSHGKMQEILEKRKGMKLPYSANELSLKILW
jgi:hypothetical protein